MPEDNFEQQAKNLVGDFSLKPNEEVWVNVQKAIEQPKRKRRFALWWWLLPMCLLGVTCWFLVNENAPITAKSNGATTEQDRKKAIDKVPGKSAELVTSNNTKGSAKVNNLTAKKEPGNIYHIKKEDKKNNEKAKQSLSKTIRLKNEDKVNSSDGIPAPKLAQTNSYSKTSSALLDSITNEKATNQPIDFTNKKTTEIPASASELPANNADSFTQKNTNAVTQKTETFTVAKTNRPDSLFVKDSAIAHLDSATILLAKKALADTASTLAKTTKKSKHTPWHFGVSAAAGTTSRNASFLNLSNEKSMSFPSDVTNGNTATGSYYRNINETGSGAMFGVGVAAQKQLSKRVYFQAGFTYKYQTYKSFTTSYRDSVFAGAVTTSTVGSFRSAEHFHFAGIYTGFQWYFLNKNKIQMGVAAGMENDLLIALKQNIKTASGATLPSPSINFSSLVANATITRKDFYNYQPLILGGLVVSVTLPKSRQLQLQPFVSNSILQFQKDNTSNNNYIFSAGLQAVYFFK